MKTILKLQRFSFTSLFLLTLLSLFFIPTLSLSSSLQSNSPSIECKVDQLIECIGNITQSNTIVNIVPASSASLPFNDYEESIVNITQNLTRTLTLDTEGLTLQPNSTSYRIQLNLYSRIVVAATSITLHRITLNYITGSSSSQYSNSQKKPYSFGAEESTHFPLKMRPHHWGALTLRDVTLTIDSLALPSRSLVIDAPSRGDSLSVTSIIGCEVHVPLEFEPPNESLHAKNNTFTQGKILTDEFILWIVPPSCTSPHVNNESSFDSSNSQGMDNTLIFENNEIHHGITRIKSSSSSNSNGTCVAILFENNVVSPENTLTQFLVTFSGRYDNYDAMRILNNQIHSSTRFNIYNHNPQEQLPITIAENKIYSTNLRFGFPQNSHVNIKDNYLRCKNADACLRLERNLLDSEDIFLSFETVHLENNHFEIENANIGLWIDYIPEISFRSNSYTLDNDVLFSIDGNPQLGTDMAVFNESYYGKNSDLLFTKSAFSITSNQVKLKIENSDFHLFSEHIIDAKTLEPDVILRDVCMTDSGSVKFHNQNFTFDSDDSVWWGHNTGPAPLGYGIPLIAPNFNLTSFRKSMPDKQSCKPGFLISLNQTRFQQREKADIQISCTQTFRESNLCDQVIDINLVSASDPPSSKGFNIGQNIRIGSSTLVEAEIPSSLPLGKYRVKILPQHKLDFVHPFSEETLIIGNPNVSITDLKFAKGLLPHDLILEESSLELAWKVEGYKSVDATVELIQTNNINDESTITVKDHQVEKWSVNVMDQSLQIQLPKVNEKGTFIFQIVCQQCSDGQKPISTSTFKPAHLGTPKVNTRPGGWVPEGFNVSVSIPRSSTLESLPYELYLVSSKGKKTKLQQVNDGDKVTIPFVDNPRDSTYRIQVLMLDKDISKLSGTFTIDKNKQFTNVKAMIGVEGKLVVQWKTKGTIINVECKVVDSETKQVVAEKREENSDLMKLNGTWLHRDQDKTYDIHLIAHPFTSVTASTQIHIHNDDSSSKHSESTSSISSMTHRSSSSNGACSNGIRNDYSFVIFGCCLFLWFFLMN